MTAYLEGKEIDTSHKKYPKKGFGLRRFVKSVYGNEVFEKIANGTLILRANGEQIYPDDTSRKYHVHEDTRIEVSDESLKNELWISLLKYHDANLNSWEATLLEMIDTIKQANRQTSF